MEVKKYIDNISLHNSKNTSFSIRKDILSDILKFYIILKSEYSYPSRHTTSEQRFYDVILTF